jgi:hypothetical protein
MNSCMGEDGTVPLYNHGYVPAVSSCYGTIWIAIKTRKPLLD